MGAYTKPHLTFQQQLERMVSRGLACDDETAAVDLLKAVGYYRLSAYVYPLRELLPYDPEAGQPQPYRSDRVRDGITFAHVEALWRFDRKLRLLCLDAIETIEIGLRTRVAYVLGQRDPHGHLNRESLDADACARPARRNGRPTGQDAFQDWTASYDSLQDKARNEDYVQHHLTKYDGEIPIWVAVEFFDFGAIARLFSLLRRDDQNSIARDLGIASGSLLAAWLRNINYLRNLCAHHARFWNRKPTLKAAKFNPRQAGSELAHAAALTPRDKMYVHLAVMAYLVRRLDPKQNWPLTLRTLIKKFPSVPDLSPVSDMGFPADWVTEPLWTMEEPT